MSNLVRVIDNLSDTILFETSVLNMNEAYTFATLMEQEGLDVRLESPALADTLMEDKEDVGCIICPQTQK